jgi:type IV pilus assembly protein PilA
MKTTPKAVRLSESGFTLVELMIVVAIIGILASIAIPNFQKYQAKARQKEATIQLAAAYTAEASQFGEQSFYSGCLSNVGYSPDLTNQRYYTVGFLTAPPAANLWTQRNAAGAGVGGQCAVGDGAAAGAATAVPPIGTYFLGTKSVSTTGGTAQANLPASVVADQTFSVGAAGNVVNTAARYDKWTIDQTKNIFNATSGI